MEVCLFWDHIIIRYSCWQSLWLERLRQETVQYSNHQNLPHMFQKQCIRIVHSTFKEEYIACVEGGVEVNQELLSSGNLIISFLQGVNVSEGSLMKAAAENLTPVTLELGGKKSGYYRKNCKI